MSDPVPIVISPGPKSPFEARATCDLARQLLGRVPILGICLGHQILATATGGDVQFAKNPRHGSVRRFLLETRCCIFSGLPESIDAATYNSLVVDPDSLRADWRIVARCEQGDVGAIAYEPFAGQPAYGLQFHPESFLSRHTAALRTNWYDVIARFYARTSHLPVKGVACETSRN